MCHYIPPFVMEQELDHVHQAFREQIQILERAAEAGLIKLEPTDLSHGYKGWKIQPPNQK